MKRVLSIYPNCSKGGMTTVYRSRALATPHEKHDFMFMHDRNGRAAFDSLSNTDYRIVSKGRFHAALMFAAKTGDYDEFRITSMPEEANALATQYPEQVIYEFHSSTFSVINRELETLEVDHMHRIQTPSDWLSNVVARRVSPRQASKCVTVPNLVDEAMFSPAARPAERELGDGKVPLLWIGRFDKGKNVNDFFRMLSLLPERYVPIVVVSYESNPDRFSRALQEARAYGVDERMQTHLNLGQEQLAGLYTWTRDRGGAFVSTSLAESFGYGIAEALACGLPTAAYRVGGVPEVPTRGTPCRLEAVGDVPAMADAVLALTRTT